MFSRSAFSRSAVCALCFLDNPARCCQKWTRKIIFEVLIFQKPARWWYRKTVFTTFKGYGWEKSARHITKELKLHYVMKIVHAPWFWNKTTVKLSSPVSLKSVQSFNQPPTLNSCLEQDNSNSSLTRTKFDFPWSKFTEMYHDNLNSSGARNENIVQNHLNIALWNVF